MEARRKRGGMTMKLLIGGLALAAVVCAAATTVNAQINPQQSQMSRNADIGRHAAEANTKGSDEAKVKANDKAYNSVLRNIPDKQFDPWRGVR
jgi:Tfp pilus assembly protein PilN